MVKTKNIVAICGIVAGLGIATTPIERIRAADASGTVDVNITVGSQISLTADASSVTGNIASGATDLNIATSTLKVVTNSGNGYKITVKDNVNGGDGSLVKASTTNKISPITEGTPTAAPAANSNTWGIKVGDTWFGVPANSANAKQIFTSGSPTAAAGVETTVTYGVAVDGSLPSGEYAGQIIYTALANN